MGAKLPSRDDLGPLPTARTGRPMVNLNGAGAMGQATAELGNAVSRVGLEIYDRQQKQEEYETLKKMVEFQRSTEQDYEEYKRTIVPSGTGFKQGWDERYHERAHEFFGKDGGNFPDRMRQKVDLALLKHGEGLSTHALKYEHAERDRFHVADIEDQFGALARDVEAQPGRLAEKQKIARALIDNAPIEPRLKPQLHKKALAGLEKTARGALVMGATTAEDFKRAEETLFVTAPIKPERAQKGDAGKLFRGPDAPKAVDPPGDPGIRALRGPQQSFAPDVESSIADAAKETGVDLGLLRTFAKIESGGDPRNKTGSYKGLFQLSDEEFKKAGGEGDIFDSRTNARAAAIKLKAESDEFERKFGRTPTPAELYMVHQQGTAGAAAHYANPDRPAWENMYSTGEGRRKGAGWAKKAIWGNIPDDVKRKFGSVEDVTSADFIKVWDQKIAGIGGGDASAAARGLGGPGEGARLPGGNPDIVSGAAPSTDPHVRWAKEESGEEVYAGPFQNSSLGDRISTYKQLEAKRKQLVGAVESEIKGYEATAAQGILPPEGYLANLTEKVEQVGDPQVKAYFESVMGLADLTSKLNKGRPADLEGLIRSERAANTDKDGVLRLTPVAAKRLAHLEKLNDTMKAQVNSDPLEWAHKVGLVQVQPIDFDKPETLAARAEVARNVGTYYGQEPKFFTKVERDVLSDKVRVGGKPMLDTLGKIVSNFGGEAALAIGEFAPKEPEAAWVGGMMLDSARNNGANMEAIKDIAHAMEIRRDKNYKRIIHDQDSTHKSDQLSAMGTNGGVFQANSPMRDAALATADLLFEARARQKGLNAYDPTLWQKGFNEVLGQSIHNGEAYGGLAYQNAGVKGFFDSRRNAPVIVPPNVKAKEFRTLIDSIRHEDLIGEFGEAPMSARGSPIAMADIRRSYLVSVGDGQYWIALGNPQEDAQFAKSHRVDEYGEPVNFVLDIKQLEPVLKKRRPDLYLDRPTSRPAGAMKLGGPGPFDAGVESPVRKTLFAGERSATADKGALTEARELETSGTDAGQIWETTGWFKGQDGKWRSEIDDSAAKVVVEPKDLQAGNYVLQDLIEHDDLFKAYPAFANMKVSVYDGSPKGAGGAYHFQSGTLQINRNASADKKALRDTLIHEIQHGLTSKEGFAYLGNPISAVFGNGYDIPGEVEARDAVNRGYESDDWRKKNSPTVRPTDVVNPRRDRK